MMTMINIGLMVLSALAHSGPMALVVFGVAGAVALMTFGAALLTGAKADL